MKTVLIITYNFPPDGGPAVQRVTKFIKNLSYFGFRSVVLTSKHKKETFDNSLLKDIPDETQIYHTIDFGDYCPGEIRNKILKNLFVPDKQKLWYLTALKKTGEIFKKEKIDIIFSTSPPHSVHLIAKKIKERFKIPWVADFRDEWTKNPSFKEFANKQKNKIMEEFVVKSTDHIVTCTNTAKTNFESLYKHKNISVIMNGYDSDDFKAISTFKEDNRLLKILYYGRLNKLHSPETLFNTLNVMLDDKFNLQNNLLFHIEIIGNNKKNDWLKNNKLTEELVKFNGYKSHNECLEKANQSDVLLLLATNMHETEFFPAKVFEYIKLKKPILAILSKKGELSSFLESYGNSFIVYEGDIDDMKKKLFLLIKLKTEDKLCLSDNNNFINNYDRKQQTEKLVELFNLLTKNE